MTREERINSALLPILEKMREHGATDEMCKMYDNGFHVGAMWADAHPHWISVEDELPPITQWVLTYNPTYDEYHFDVERYGRGENLVDFGVTHWMPLPQVPKKGGDQ